MSPPDDVAYREGIQTMNHVTAEMLALIGVATASRTGSEPIKLEALARFADATMDHCPWHVDEDAAAATRFGGVVAPGLYPAHAVSETGGDGTERQVVPALPKLDHGLGKKLNAGSEVEFFQYASLGDVISEVSSYAEIEQKQSSKGPMVLETIVNEYTNQDGAVLIAVRKTSINR